MTDVDCRWNVIAASVDDRTREERGLSSLSNNKFRIHKSRYDSIDSYLSPEHEKLVKPQGREHRSLDAGNARYGTQNYH